MQKNILKKIIKFSLILVLLISLFILIIFHSNIRKTVEKAIYNKVIYVIKQKFQVDISVDDIKFSFKNGLKITVGKIKSDISEHIKFKAEKLEILLSLFQGLYHKQYIEKINFYKPNLILNLNNISKTDTNQSISFSINPSVMSIPIIIDKGSIRILFENNLYNITDINGKLNQNSLDLSMSVLNSDVFISLNYIKNQLTGVVKIKNFNLQNINKHISGTTDANFLFDIIKNNQYTYNAKVSLNGNKTIFSWCDKSVNRYKLDFEIAGNSKKIDIKKIALKTSLVEFSGQVNIFDINNYIDFNNGKFNLLFSSNKFKYNEFVRLIPKNHLEKWLSKLLFKQIRNGKMSFPQISCKGAFKDFSNWFTVYKNLYIKGKLEKSSFRSIVKPSTFFNTVNKNSPPKISNITATILCKNANIYVKNISGYAGSSKIDKVDLTFLDCKKDEFKMTADVCLDMNSVDFLTAWKASLFDKELCHMLDPILLTDKKGRIKANIQYENDIQKIGVMNIGGDAYINNCSFNFYDQNFENITGFAKADILTSQLMIDIAGKYEQLSIKHCNLIFKDMFSPDRYTFSLVTDDIPETDNFSFSKNTKIMLTGKGEQQNIEGKLNFLTDGFQVKGLSYKPIQENFSGNGFFSGQLWPSYFIKLKEIMINHGPDKPLVLNAKIKSNIIDLQIAGDLEIESSDIPNTIEKHSIKTDCNIDFTWKDNNTFLTRVDARKLLCQYGQLIIDAQGSFNISENNIAFKPLNITHDNLKFILLGSLDFGDIPHYTGKVFVDGFKLKRDNQPNNKLLNHSNDKISTVAKYEHFNKKLSADAHIFMKNTELYGIKIDTLSGDIKLKNKNIVFSKIEAFNKQGKVSGDINIFQNKTPTFDFTFSIDNQNLISLNKIIAPKKMIITGNAKIEGNLYGSFDSINGNINLIAKNGTILKENIILKIFGMLNIYKLFKSGSLDLDKKNISFNHITTTLEIKDNIISTDNFHFDSNNVPMTFLGEYNINTDIIKGIMAVQLFESADKLLSIIPVIGWVLTGNKKKLFLVTLNIEGDINNPTVTIAPIDTISKPVVDSFLRVLKLPQEILTNPLKFLYLDKPLQN